MTTPAHILLVESDRQLGEIYRDCLLQAGWTVSLCRTAQTALQAMEAALPAVIVLDIELPRHNGIELLYELRSYSEWQQVPVMLLSQAVRPVDHPAWRQLGVSRQLYKPLTSLAGLVQAVRLQLAHDHQAALAA